MPKKTKSFSKTDLKVILCPCGKRVRYPNKKYCSPQCSSKYRFNEAKTMDNNFNDFLTEYGKAKMKHGSYSNLGEGFLAILEEGFELFLELIKKEKDQNPQKIQEESLHLCVTSFKMAEFAKGKHKEIKESWTQK